MIGCDSGYVSAFLDQSVARAMYSDRLVATGTAATTTGEARRAPGGYWVSGRLPFVSGCHHSEWAWLGCTVVEDGCSASSRCACCFDGRRSRPTASVGKSCGQTNSAAIPLLSRLIPLIGRKIPLFGCVAEFASDSNKISFLQGRVWPAMGRNRRLLLFFPVEQGN
jgi:hypothetical protein